MNSNKINHIKARKDNRFRFIVLILPSLAYADNNSLFVEASTMGLRLGYTNKSWDIFTRFDVDFSGSIYDEIDEANDSITYADEWSMGSSNIEFGIGGDYFWQFESSHLGIRGDIAYLYPYSTFESSLKYNNRLSSSYRAALLARRSIGPISIGCSIGPVANWVYRHYISEFTNQYGVKIRFDRTSNIVEVDLNSEIFARYEF